MASKGTILVVDDNRLVLATLADGLTRAGYGVHPADNGDDAILLAREHHPDLALLDIRMEGKSGFDVAEYLRAHGKVPFMFLSAFADADTAAQVKALGAVDYLVKPLDMKQIVLAVAAAFARLAPGDRPSPARAPSAPGLAVAEPHDDVVAMAAGVLMQRDGSSRGDASSQLRRLAAESGRTAIEQAEALLGAIEARRAGA